MKRSLFFILLLVCLILPFNVLALEFYKGNSYTGYENLDLFSGDVTNTPDGGYIVFGDETDSNGDAVGSLVIKINNKGEVVKTTNELGKNLRFIFEYKNMLFAIIGEYVNQVGNLSSPKENVKIYKFNDDLTLGDLVYSNDNENAFSRVYEAKDYFIAYAVDGRYSTYDTACKIPGVYRFDYDGTEFHKTDITPDGAGIYDDCNSILMPSVFGDVNIKYNKFSITDFKSLYAFNVDDTSNYIFKYSAASDDDNLFASVILNNGKYVVYHAKTVVDDDGNYVDEDKTLIMLDESGNVVKTVPVAGNGLLEDMHPTSDGGLIIYACVHNDLDSSTCYIGKYDENLNLVGKIDIGTFGNAKDYIIGSENSIFIQLKNGDIALSFMTNSALNQFNVTGSENNKLVNLIFKLNKLNEIEDIPNTSGGEIVVKIPDLGAKTGIVAIIFGVLFIVIGGTAIVKKLMKKNIT